MARDWMRDRNELDRDERRRLRGDWDRDVSRSFSSDTDRDRWAREATSDRDEDRSFTQRYGTERGYGGSMGVNYDRDRMYGGERYNQERGYLGGFGDFDRDRERGMGMSRDRDREEGRHLGGAHGGGGYDRITGGYDRIIGGGYDRGVGYGGYGGAGYGAYGMTGDRTPMGRSDRFDFGDRYRNRNLGGRERLGGEYRHRDEDRGFFQRMGDWFSDVTGVGEERPRGRGPRNYTRSDERIRDDVYDRLMDNPWVDSSEVEVKVSNAEVTLTGTVPSRHDKRTIEDIAESVLGVKEVHNQLRRADRTQQQMGTTGTTGRPTTDNGPRRDLRT